MINDSSDDSDRPDISHGEQTWFSDPEAILATLRSAPLQADDQPDCPGYDMLGEIARGGQGVVYLAVQRSTRRRVAVKVLLDKGFASPAARRRFEREIELVSTLDHPNIVRVLDGGACPNGQLFLVMELVDGVPLATSLRALAREPRAIARLLALVADGVHAAHRTGVLHRDLKPSNVLVDGDGRPRIVDFGLARAIEPGLGGPTISVSGQFLGSLPWASPEHATGVPERVDVRSDLYSLGAIFFEAITGERPTRTEGSLADALHAIAHRDVARPSSLRSDLDRRTARAVDAIAAVALAKDPDRRYQSAADFAADLRAFASGEAIMARPDGTFATMARTVRRYRAAFAATAAATLVLIAVTIVALQQAHTARIERERAERNFAQVRDIARRFLVDVHEQIVPLPGSRPARETLVTTALAYLRGLAADADVDPDFAAELADAWERVGDIQGSPTLPNLGRASDAIDSYREALALRRGVLAQRPNDISARLALGSTVSQLAYLRYFAGEVDAALDGFGEAAVELDAARAARPDDPKVLAEWAACRDRRAEALASLGRTDDAVAEMELVREAAERMLRSAVDRPRALDNLALARGKLAGILVGADRTADARREIEASVALVRDALAERPEDALLRRSLNVKLNLAGEILIVLDLLDEARAALDESLVLVRLLHDADPDDALLASDYAYTLNKLGELHLRRDEPEEAYERFAESLPIRQRDAARDPLNGVARRGEVVAHFLAGGAGEQRANKREDVTERVRLLTIARDHYAAAAVAAEAMEADGVLRPSDQTIPELCRTQRDRLSALIERGAPAASPSQE